MILLSLCLCIRINFYHFIWWLPTYPFKRKDLVLSVSSIIFLHCKLWGLICTSLTFTSLSWDVRPWVWSHWSLTCWVNVWLAGLMLVSVQFLRMKMNPLVFGWSRLQIQLLICILLNLRISQLSLTWWNFAGIF